jgi:hypothetical protein
MELFSLAEEAREREETLVHAETHRLLASQPLPDLGRIFHLYQDHLLYLDSPPEQAFTQKNL